MSLCFCEARMNRSMVKRTRSDAPPLLTAMAGLEFSEPKLRGSSAAAPKAKSAAIQCRGHCLSGDVPLGTASECLKQDRKDTACLPSCTSEPSNKTGVSSSNVAVQSLQRPGTTCDSSILGNQQPGRQGGVPVLTQLGSSRSWVNAKLAPSRISQKLRRLQGALSALPRDVRRNALQGLPSNVRFELLRHMQCAVPPCPSRSSAEHSGAMCKAQKCAGTNQAKVKIHHGSPQTATKRSLKFCVAANAVTHASKVGAGVSRKSGGYVAQLRLIPYLTAVSRCQPSRQAAARCRAVLERARQLGLEAENSSIAHAGAACAQGWVEEDQSSCLHSLKSVVEQACTEHGVSVHDLSLSFCAMVDCHQIVGCTVCGSFTTSLQEALSQRAELLVGRVAGWTELRSAWVRIMRSQVQVRTSGVWGQGKPAPKSVEAAERLADAAWKAHQSSLAARAARYRAANIARLRSVVEEAKAAIDASESMCQAASLRRSKKKALLSERANQREVERLLRARRRWHRAPQRTMEELLQGPPVELRKDVSRWRHTLYGEGVGSGRSEKSLSFGSRHLEV